MDELLIDAQMLREWLYRRMKDTSSYYNNPNLRYIEAIAHMETADALRLITFMLISAGEMLPPFPRS
jgi:hypothetical protein